MEDIVLHVAVGVKNDALTQEAGEDALAAMLEDVIHKAVLSLPWVTDLLTSKGD